MSSEDDIFFDEQQVVDFIKNYLPQESKDKFSDDDIVYILDLMMEYYDAEGTLEDDPDEEGFVLVDKDKMVDYIMKEAKKNGMGPYQPEDLVFVVQGEMEFANSLYDEGE